MQQKTANFNGNAFRQTADGVCCSKTLAPPTQDSPVSQCVARQRESTWNQLVTPPVKTTEKKKRKRKQCQCKILQGLRCSVLVYWSKFFFFFSETKVFGLTEERSKEKSKVAHRAVCVAAQVASCESYFETMTGAGI